jgi:CDP-glycerol glycerophosphotransferase (TagB/SpsB family)
MSDFYQDSARRRLEQLNANRAAQIADLEAHRLNGDHDAAAECIQQLADIDSARANLTQLYQNYVQSQQPPAPEQLTDEERHARPWNKMTYSDVLELTKTSKYFKDGWNADMQAGYVEAQRRRHRGE